MPSSAVSTLSTLLSDRLDALGSGTGTGTSSSSGVSSLGMSIGLGMDFLGPCSNGTGTLDVNVGVVASRCISVYTRNATWSHACLITFECGLSDGITKCFGPLVTPVFSTVNLWSDHPRATTDVNTRWKGALPHRSQKMLLLFCTSQCTIVIHIWYTNLTRLIIKSHKIDQTSIFEQRTDVECRQKHVSSMIWMTWNSMEISRFKEFSLENWSSTSNSAVKEEFSGI